MFSTNYIPMFAPDVRAQTLATWREAASLVRARWQAFVEADSKSRGRAFEVFVAALDAEEAAAIEMAALSPSRIAA
jgi:hypothetical protein